ncbi:MAG: glycoside hydrolase family 127 protein [Christensenellales bacterium]|jgi:DUF1680 family protein
MLKEISSANIKLHSGFWLDRLTQMAKVTAPLCLDRCEETGRLSNFRRAAGWEKGPFQGLYYNDSDVYKVLEGIAYILIQRPDPVLEARGQAVIDSIIAAAEPDGYIFTSYTLGDTPERWQDMRRHEAYCLGHMVEGAVAWSRATGRNTWLEMAERAVRQMMETLGPDKAPWVTGHEELELALVKLSRYTGKRCYLDYALWLLEQRGRGYFSYPGKEDTLFRPSYHQDDIPVRELSRVTGHAVRAMYLYCGMADVAGETGDTAMFSALNRLWNHVVPANLYITGGIGQEAAHEGFTEDWSLPNLTAYCETCAAIGMALWNQRMYQATGHAKYADLVERELFNGALAGISRKGDRFFYVNPLSSVGNHHRSEWFGTSCCPTNLIRFLPSVSGYTAVLREEALEIAQYTSCAIQAGGYSAEVTATYPYEGKIDIRIVDCPANARLRLRIPGWCSSWVCSRTDSVCAENFLSLPVSRGESITLNFSMPPVIRQADPRIRETAGRVAVTRGPLVYCAEETDNPGFIREYFHCECDLPKDAPVLRKDADGITRILFGKRVLSPYYDWDNRQPGAMAVWLKS